MRRDELMKSDVLSVVVLVGSGMVVAGMLLMIAVAAFASAAALR